jgi:hypothetical protein
MIEKTVYVPQKANGDEMQTFFENPLECLFAEYGVSTNDIKFYDENYQPIDIYNFNPDEVFYISFYTVAAVKAFNEYLDYCNIDFGCFYEFDIGCYMFVEASSEWVNIERAINKLKDTFSNLYY